MQLFWDQSIRAVDMRPIERFFMEKRACVRLHWVTWFVCFACCISFTYLMLAGEQTSYEKPPGTYVSPAYEQGWPFLFMIRGPNIGGGLTQRWLIEPPQLWGYFSWPWLLIDVGLLAVVAFGVCATIERWSKRARLTFRLSHLFALVAWSATCISLMIRAERMRSVSYFYTQDQAEYSEPVKRLLFDSDTLIDCVPTAIAVVAIGLFWLWVIDTIGWLASLLSRRR